MASDAPLQKVVHELLDRLIPALGLDRWQIKRVTDGDGEETACCSAAPEYSTATICVNLDRLQTGDELDEILVHEAVHAVVWPIAEVADELVIAVAELLPEASREPMAKLLREQARKAEERTTTDLGRIIVQLLRTQWAAEGELAHLKKEVRELRRKTT